MSVQEHKKKRKEKTSTDEKNSDPFLSVTYPRRYFLSQGGGVVLSGASISSLELKIAAGFRPDVLQLSVSPVGEKEMRL